jgi:hypothetical protein
MGGSARFVQCGPDIALTYRVSRKEPFLRAAMRLAIAATVALLAAGPAFAAGSVALPEPSGVTLLAAGVAGLLIGRQIARKRDD